MSDYEEGKCGIVKVSSLPVRPIETHRNDADLIPVHKNLLDWKSDPDRLAHGFCQFTFPHLIELA